MSQRPQPIEYVLSENLLFLRKKNFLTEEGLAKNAGLTVRAYREIEEERYLPTVSVLVRLARALRCKLDDLLPINEVEY